MANWLEFRLTEARRRRTSSRSSSPRLPTTVPLEGPKLDSASFDELAAALDDDVDWAIYGPIDMFPFLGARRGRDAVLEVVKQIAENVRVHRFDRETIMLGVDSAASMMRYSLTSLESNKPISLRVAHFAQFKGGRLSNIRVLMDSFDLVEQALGHPLHLPRMTA